MIEIGKAPTNAEASSKMICKGTWYSWNPKEHPNFFILKYLEWGGIYSGIDFYHLLGIENAEELLNGMIADGFPIGVLDLIFTNVYYWKQGGAA